MKRELEGVPCVHTWSLKNEGLLNRELASGPVTLFRACRPTLPYREWESCEVKITASIIGEPSEHDAARRSFAMSWAQSGQSCRVAVDAIGQARTVGGRCGLRWWWLCPLCSRRVNALYLIHARMACRKCQGLAYASERFSRLQRALNPIMRGPATNGAALQFMGLAMRSRPWVRRG